MSGMGCGWDHCSGVVKCALNDTDQTVGLTLTSWGGMANCPGIANACETDNTFMLVQIICCLVISHSRHDTSMDRPQSIGCIFH